MVLGRLRLRCLWDGQADMHLDKRRKARNMELRVITINSGGWYHEFIWYHENWEGRNRVAG